MPSDPRPTLFLSSTARDLEPFREVVIHVCRRLGIDVIAMEEFGPDPREAAVLCRSKIEEADLFLGLYAHRYGFQPEGFDGKSITQLEYEWALEQRPVPTMLAFIVDEDVLWPPKWIDRGDSSERLESFKAQLRGAHVVSALTTPDKLRDDLFVHLPKFRDQAGQRQMPEPAPALPLPPETYVAHQYTLLQTEQVMGRREELAQLDAWMSDPAGPRLLSVVAIGGIGKSALTWKWFHDRAPRDLAGKMWWSFYEADAGFDRFVTMALAYCGRRSIESVQALSPVDREWQLLNLLDREPFLIALDGLERILLAYSNLDFAHLTDDDLDRRTANAVAGAMDLPGEAGETFLARHRLRQTTDPRIGEFLRKLATVRSSRLLVTTRLYPAALQTNTGYEIPGCRAWFLHGLTPADAQALWQAMGVSGDRLRLRAFFESINHYPLLIRALAGEVAEYRPAPGDFDRWQKDHPDFDPFALPLVQAKSHVLAYALGDLAVDGRDVLHTIAAFRSPVEYTTLSGLFVEGRAWGPGRLDSILTDLEDRGLVGWDRSANRYDLHPVVRGVVWAGLDNLNRQTIYGNLERHFAASQEAEGKPGSAKAVNGAIELFSALVGLGRYADAYAIYRGRLDEESLLHFGRPLSHTRVALLETLFPAGLDQDPAVADDLIASVLLSLSMAYREVGRLGEAWSFGHRNLSAADESSGWIGSRLLSDIATDMGYMREVIRYTERAEETCLPFVRRFFTADLAVAQARMGRKAEALHDLALQEPDEHFNPERYEATIRLWSSEYGRAAELARRSVPSEPKSFRPRMELNLVLGGALIGLENVQEAEGVLLAVLHEARATGVLSAELESLRWLAESHRLRGDFVRSRALLAELAEPAARGPYRLIQADAANTLAAVERDCGDRESAIVAARQAYELAWCDGPPFAYDGSLQRAAQLLRELGATPPEVHAQRTRHARDSR